jgi:glycosidase
MSNEVELGHLRNAIEKHLQVIYPDHHSQITKRVVGLVERYGIISDADSSALWSEQDVVMITYGDSILVEGKTPLKGLDHFLEEHIGDTINGVHILPFYPYSSDDGFSVIDYRMVNPNLGDWRDIKKLSQHHRLMFDLVINHVSRESLWFYDFVANLPPAKDFFHALPQETDVSLVTRPRNSPLLVPVTTRRGMLYVWATFSEDQIDVNFGNPEVLLEYLDILLLYIRNGARIIRLDAIAFLWKQLGTSCIHLEQTHEVVKLIRTLTSYVSPDTVILTETNVPHKENISYFGEGDEAHMVYQFSLPPLTLHALNRGTSQHLNQWAASLKPLPPHCTYFNFTASHDGVGLRGLEGILERHEIDDLIECMHRYGGFVSMKANSDGEPTPYEINISLFDALQGTRRGLDQWQVNRFVCSQAIMLALQGVPGIYIHSLLATPNDLQGVEVTGRTRSINRKSWQYEDLIELLDNPHTPNSEVFKWTKQLIDIRSNEICFHPDNPQQVIEINNSLFAFIRTDRNSQRKLFAIYNVTSAPQEISLPGRPKLTDKPVWFDLVTQTELAEILPSTTLQPYQFVWLVERE